MLSNKIKSKILPSNIWSDLSILPLDTHGWNGKCKVFEDLICQHKPNLILELGTWKGQSCFSMLEAASKINLDTQIICVDTWLGSLEMLTLEPPSNTKSDTIFVEEFIKQRDTLRKNGYPGVYFQFLSNCVHLGYSNRVFPIPNTTSVGIKFLKSLDIHPDMIYVDASHDYEDSTRDIRDSWDLLSPGGVMFGDDYNSWWGVEKSVDEFAENNNVKIEFFSLLKGWNIRFEQTYWIIRKK